MIAINQDPSSSAGVRKWRYYVNDTDEYGQGEISLWTNTLASGDVVVALVNAGNNSREMNATLQDIFLDASTAVTSGPSPLLMEAWDVYDLWANRMDDATASAILNGNATMNVNIMNITNITTRYNSTEMSYADGLAMNNSALLGAKTMTVDPMGTLTATIPGHGIGFYRLRSQGASSMRKRDEL